MPAGAEASREVLRSIISDRSRHLCVATRGDEVVGSAELIVVPNLTHRASPWAVIEDVIVDAAVRGGGAGTALLQHLATVARANGCYRSSSTPASSALTPIACIESLSGCSPACRCGYRLRLRFAGGWPLTWKRRGWLFPGRSR